MANARSGFFPSALFVVVAVGGCGGLGGHDSLEVSGTIVNYHAPRGPLLWYKDHPTDARIADGTYASDGSFHITLPPYPPAYMLFQDENGAWSDPCGPNSVSPISYSDPSYLTAYGDLVFVSLANNTSYNQGSLVLWDYDPTRPTPTRYRKALYRYLFDDDVTIAGTCSAYGGTITARLELKVGWNLELIEVDGAARTTNLTTVDPTTTPPGLSWWEYP